MKAILRILPAGTLLIVALLSVAIPYQIATGEKDRKVPRSYTDWNSPLGNNFIPSPSPSPQLSPSLDVTVRAGLNFGFTFSSDGALLATASSHDVKIYKTDTGQELPGLKHKGEALSVAFSPNGQYIVTGTNVEIETDEAQGVWIWMPLNNLLSEIFHSMRMLSTSNLAHPATIWQSRGLRRPYGTLRILACQYGIGMTGTR